MCTYEQFDGYLTARGSWRDGQRQELRPFEHSYANVTSQSNIQLF